MKKQFYEEYYQLERKHWWFRARLEILEHILQARILNRITGTLNILNAGVASGATTLMLQQYGDITSLEYDEECCEFLRDTVDIDVINGSLTQLPFEDNSFDLVCAFDVIEHIREHSAAISEIERVLKPGGHAFITVPAFDFLWSQHDEIHHHYRRYTRTEIRRLLEAEGLRIQYDTYFNSLLFVPILLFRKLGEWLSDRSIVKSNGSDLTSYQHNSRRSQFFHTLFRTEKHLLDVIRFPFGVSIVSIAQKQAE